MKLDDQRPYERNRLSPAQMWLAFLGGGAVTLIVALTGINPAWLVVGPLIIVTVLILASSSLVRSLPRRLLRVTR